MIDSLDKSCVVADRLLFRLFVRSSFATKPAILGNLETLRLFLFVFGAVVIDTITDGALKMNYFAHFKSSSFTVLG